MLRRCLELCLGDHLKPRRDGVVLDYAVVAESSAGLPSLFRPLEALFHLLGHAPGLSQAMGEARLADRSGAAERGAMVDFGATLRLLRTGSRRIVRRPSAADFDDDAVAFALVVQEFLGRAHVLLALLEEQKASTREGLRQPLAELDERIEGIRAALDQRGLSHDCVRFAAGLLRRSLSLFRAFLVGDTHGPEADGWRGSLLLRRFRPSDGLAPLLDWRRRFHSTGLFFGSGRTYRFSQSRDESHLFELWCLAEWVSAHRLRSGSGEQTALLRPARHGETFRLDRTHDVLFAFRGRSPSTDVRKILRRSNVEWFILNRENYRRSVVVDTKNYGSWSLAPNRTVLGYMHDFQVDRGVVIFSKPLRVDAYDADEADERLVVRRFGSAGQRTFCAVSLIPSPGEAERNLDTLRRCARALAR
ncbi:MAG: hypothetical protein AAF682_27590 [Planctomycetota bacterium]